MPARARVRLRAAAQDGSLLIEVLAAMFVLVVGGLGGLATLNASDHLAGTTQRQQIATAMAEQVMESIRATTYSNLALSSLPTHTSDGNATTDHSGNPSNPAYWVSGSNLLIPQNFSSESSATLSGVSSTGEVMISGGSISPGPSTITIGSYTGTAYRFVSWVDDRCTYGGSDKCPGTQDARRVTVAVVLGGSGTGVTKPVWLSSVVADPQAGVDGL